MDLYLLFKFLHVASVIVWLGAGAALLFLGIAAERAPDREQFGRVLDQVNFMAPRVFIPASGATLLFGLIATWLQWSFGDLWIILGLVGFAATFGTGNFLIRPRAEKLAEMVKAEGYTPAALGKGGEILSITKFDMVMLFAVVAVMVYKPTLNDVGVLVLLALVLVAAAVAFLRGPIMGTPAKA
jgi:uncharacterized membrane protein